MRHKHTPEELEALRLTQMGHAGVNALITEMARTAPVVAALRELTAMIATNYAPETIRYEGAYDRAKAALRDAGELEGLTR